MREPVHPAIIANIPSPIADGNRATFHWCPMPPSRAVADSQAAEVSRGNLSKSKDLLGAPLVLSMPYRREAFDKPWRTRWFDHLIWTQTHQHPVS